MSLYQVTASWAEYPKGLEDVEEDETADDPEDEGASISKSLASAVKRPKLGAPSRVLQSPNTSSSSTTPSSISSSSLALPSDSPNSSTSSFTPVGIGRKTSQRDEITESPLFVTWNRISSTGSVSLRGCIGCFEPQALGSGLAFYALTSALGDVRFNPVTLSEVPKLGVAVTLLTDFETCADPMDWELGVHGIRISFYHHHKRFSATYLPDVAVEQGWNKEETMLSLMRKAGWQGKKEKWREVGDLKVTRYQGKQESVEYQEYKRWKDWVSANGKK